jgi:molybdopterin-synthase adenylyltransferase
MQSMSCSRYHRQEILPEVGAAGQARLAGGHALIVGCGALGCVVSQWLVRAGVGTITIVDRDLVDLTNLQRQVLFTQEDAARRVPKAIAAQEHLSAVNSEVRVRAVCEDVRAHNAESIVCDVPDAPPVGVIVDGTDSFETRYLLNDVSVSAGIPMVYAGVIGTEGTTMTVLPGDGPCLRCVVEDPPASGSVETCDTAGVLGPAVGVLASIEASETLKVLLGARDAVSRDLVRIDVWSGRVQRIDVSGARREDCPCCGRGEFEFLEEEAATEVRTLCGRDAVQITPAVQRVDLDALAQKLGRVGAVERAHGIVRTTLAQESGERGEAIMICVFPTGRAIISGTTDQKRARSVYARYVGA